MLQLPTNANGSEQLLLLGVMPMSFADPQTLTIAPASAVSLPRVSVGDDTSEYMSNDALLKLSASHSYGKRWRRMLRIDVAKVSADTYKPTENVKHTMSLYTVFDLPPAGFTPTEALAIWTGYKTQVSASSDLLITKLLGGES
jgi:hypothetical protein